MELTTRDGASLYYQTFGDKDNTTLIFLHGNMEDNSFFKKQLEYFSVKYHVVVPDTRGHGKSGWGDNNIYDLRLLAEDLMELVKILKLQKYFVIGFSDGANIAMEYATFGHDGMMGLVLTGGNLRPWGMKVKVILEIVMDYIKSYKDPEGLKTRKILGLMLFEPKIKKSALAVINIPTLILAGEKDMIYRRETLRIGKRIKGSKTIFIENADHFFIYNKWDIFNKMLEQWINSV